MLFLGEMAISISLSNASKDCAQITDRFSDSNPLGALKHQPLLPCVYMLFTPPTYKACSGLKPMR